MIYNAPQVVVYYANSKRGPEVYPGQEKGGGDWKIRKLGESGTARVCERERDVARIDH